MLDFSSAISGNLHTTLNMVDHGNNLLAGETLDSLMKITEPVWLTVASLSAMVLGLMILTPVLQPKWKRKDSSDTDKQNFDPQGKRDGEHQRKDILPESIVPKNKTSPQKWTWTKHERQCVMSLEKLTASDICLPHYSRNAQGKMSKAQIPQRPPWK